MFYFRGTRKPNFSKINKLDYDEYWQERGFAMRGKLMEREEIFFSWVSPKSKVLDIGCGNSRLLLELKQKKACEAAGIDISPLVVENLEKNGIRGRIFDLAKDDLALEEKYDYIILSEILEHLSQPEDLIARLSNQTKYFIISVPNSAFYRYRLGLMFKGRFFTQWVSHPSEHLRFWSHLDFLDWLKSLNLELVKSYPSNGFWFKNFWPNLFGHQICYLAKTK
ncbi:MAG: hypothetical protein A3J65_04580 [Candidatus Buchananbacteria bacterium RIFCSPHIGHO2_02_FULL_45_11b]|uniref:Methionine biosynthesis protein MetW n=1 Tax=Candidatus Buchananbacteria bacterium RIFCSPHIGHO2_02_FULL_45_11b TaxID=1797541 RepID=A0A1G1YFL2_9BACT|nr:MAG: hypothetical protein A3J65_04580 [Candidatus Buchananbacteria bacterium RIFCSPHIGHO2_02_FULL_45_11b]